MIFSGDIPKKGLYSACPVADVTGVVPEGG